MAHDMRTGMCPSGFEGHVKDAPQDPQMAYNNNEPLVRSSSTTGRREPEIYAEQVAGMTPKTQGNMP